MRASVLRRAMTEPEKKLWWHLRHRLPLERGHFRRQVPISSFIVDFCHLGSKLVVEVDGSQHGFERNAERDRERDRHLAQQGFRVLRFSNREVMSEIDGVLDTIRAALFPPPCGEGGPEGRVGVAKPERGAASGDECAPAARTRSPGRTTPTPTPPRKGEGNVGSAELRQSRAEALTLLRRSFSAAGLEEAALDARLLLLGALGLDGSALVTRPHEPLTTDQATRLEDFARRRLHREPVARILGEREFWSLPFALSPGTLVPRPETETVVETVLALRPERSAPLRLLDLGTGSGCLLVALLHEYGQAFGIGLDRSFGALATARRNAERNGVAARAAFVLGDWSASLRGSLDVIVSNPPYIRTDVLPALDPDVRIYDPSLALDGGPDGLDAYRVILGEAQRLLAPEGILAVEIGYDQEAPIRDLAALAGLDVLRIAPDLGGHPRCVAMQRPRS
jgi:release factor glutamine methyltransferase